MVTRGYSWLLVREFPKITVQHCSPVFFLVPGVIKSVLGIFPSFLWVISLVQHGECQQGMLNITQSFGMLNFISSYVKLVDSKTLHISS